MLMMLRLRVLLFMSTLWLASSDSPRLQRVYTASGSYLAKVAEKKAKTVPSGNTLPNSPMLSENMRRSDPYDKLIPSSIQKMANTAPHTPPVAQHYISSPSSLPLVDIFFIFADMLTSSTFVQAQYFWVLPTVAAMQIKTTKRASAAESKVRIHILSDSVEVLEKASSLGFYSYNLLPYIDKHKRFLNRVGHTVNSTASELGFFRWKVLNHIVTDWNSHGAASLIRRVMVLNGEVLLTVNAAALFDRAVSFAHTNSGSGSTSNSAVAPEAIYITDSVMLYSPQGLSAFDAYIDQWFNGCKRDELHQKSVGTHDRPWSDVILFEHFASSSTPATLRVKWLDATAPDGSRKQLEQKHIHALGCEPLAYYDNPYGVHVRVNGLPYQLRNQPLQGNQVLQDPRIHETRIFGPGKQYPYCFMGFVHKHVKGLMYAYGRALEILRGGEEAHNPSALDSLAGDLLLAPEKSREVYYIYSNSSRYFIPNKAEFTHLFLARGQVIGRVPIGIIEAFHPLPLQYPWKEGEIVSFGKNRVFYYVDTGKVLRPLASQDVFKRFNQTTADVKTYKEYSGPILQSIPIGPSIDVQVKR